MIRRGLHPSRDEQGTTMNQIRPSLVRPKLPVTVLSRCLQFSLKNMPPERVVELHAGVEYEADERVAGGRPRRPRKWWVRRRRN